MRKKEIYLNHIVSFRIVSVIRGKKRQIDLLGVVFTGGQGPEAQIIKRILEIEIKNAQSKQHTLFIAADSGLAAAQDAGIKPDWIIGDMDSIDQRRLALCPPERVIRHPRDKDFTDTELAFNLAAEKNCDIIWIIGGGGGRIDHLFGIRSMFERENFPYRWITAQEDIYCINAETELCCTLQKSACVSVFPLGSGPWDAKSKGLKWPLAGVPWTRGFFGLSNVAVNGEFSVTAQKGRFMVILPVE